jgi:hypothetical protein
MTINKDDLAAITSTIAAALSAALGQQSQVASPKPTNGFLPKGSHSAPSDLAAKDARIVAAFARRGFKVTLMDRNDPKLPFDTRPYKGWLEVGRVVRKGQHGVRGLFHVTQTDMINPPTPSKGKKLAAVKS